MSLLPQDKFDCAAVARLAALPPDVIAPLLPELLTWLQDADWPVALPLAAFLRPWQPQLDETIAAVLHGKDEEWKTALLTQLLDARAGAATLREVARIAQFPTAEERAAGVDAAARAVLLAEH